MVGLIFCANTPLLNRGLCPGFPKVDKSSASRGTTNRHVSPAMARGRRGLARRFQMGFRRISDGFQTGCRWVQMGSKIRALTGFRRVSDGFHSDGCQTGFEWVQTGRQVSDVFFQMGFRRFQTGFRRVLLGSSQKVSRQISTTIFAQG